VTDLAALTPVLEEHYPGRGLRMIAEPSRDECMIVGPDPEANRVVWFAGFVGRAAANGDLVSLDQIFAAIDAELAARTPEPAPDPEPSVDPIAPQVRAGAAG
jgi:hypothetical protein